MRAIVIDAEKRDIYEHEISSNDEHGLAEMQALVGGNIEPAFPIEDASEETTDELYVNEEGLFGNPEHFFFVEGAHQPFAGNGVILGLDVEAGRSIPARISLEDIRKKVSFMSKKEALEKALSIEGEQK